jgi:hypothetical protein
MKKRLAIYCVFGVLIYVGYLFYCYFSDGITEENLERLEIGMTKTQVHGLIGVEPDYTVIHVVGQVHQDWIGTDGSILVAFDDKDRLIWKAWDERRRRPTAWQRLILLGEHLLDSLFPPQKIRE